jgi:hypothetical protein
MLSKEQWFFMVLLVVVLALNLYAIGAGWWG